MRPEKITYDLINAICEDISRGYSYDKAAERNGISSSTFFRWLKLGKSPDSEQIYRDFAQAVRQASDFSEDEALQLIRSAAVINRNWKASAWFLEKRFPAKYGKPANQCEGEIESEEEGM